MRSKKIPPSEMLHFTTNIGHHQTNVFRPFFATKENWAMISVILKPSEKRNITSEQIVKDLKKRLKNFRVFQNLMLNFTMTALPLERLSKFPS